MSWEGEREGGIRVVGEVRVVGGVHAMRGTSFSGTHTFPECSAALLLHHACDGHYIHV